MQQTSRIKWIDALKFFAIFMVLWGHSVQHLLSSEYVDEPVYRVIYSFHMPLFMALVGFFGARLASRSFLTVLTQKFRQLILPILSITAIVLLFNELSKWGGVNSDLWFINFHPGGWFWFLKCAFVCSLTYWLATRFGKYDWISLELSLIVSQLFLWHQFNLMYPCFVLGAVISRNLNWFCKNSGKITLISGIIFIGMLFFWDQRFWRGITIFDDDRTVIYIDLFKEWFFTRYYRMAIGIAGTVFFIGLFEFLSHKIPSTKLGDRIIKWGSYTLGIYIFQTFILEFIMQHYLKFDSMNFYLFNFVIAPIISLGVLLACVGIIELIKKSEWTNWLLLGGKMPFKLSVFTRPAEEKG